MKDVAFNRLRWEITPRQATLGIIVACAIGSWVALIVNLVNKDGQLAVFLVGPIASTVLGFVYWRMNWRWAPAVLISAFTLLIMVGLPQMYVDEKLSLGILMPSLLALMLLNEWWVIGVGVAIAVALIVRSGGTGPFAGDSVTMVIYAVAIATMVLIRLVTTTALSIAQSSTARAEEAHARAERQAQELAEANELMSEQLDHQRQLLDLVTALETPVVPLAEGMLFAPIVGRIDSHRAQALATRLLEQTNVQRAQALVLDIAGVPVVDKAVALSLLHVIEALRLLGCVVILSGVSASVVLALVHLGINLDEIHTVRSPQEALNLYLKPPPDR